MLSLSAQQRRENPHGGSVGIQVYPRKINPLRGPQERYRSGKIQSETRISMHKKCNTALTNVLQRIIL